jgi:hypothetical protein
MRRGAGLIAAGAALVALVAAAALHAAPQRSTPWKAWLCMPGDPKDWCAVDLTTTVIAADGSRRTVPVSVLANPPVDCFYVYPTVSTEQRGNATLRVHPEERETAIVQAARFSHVCRVYAPLYRQTTAFRDRYHGDPKLAYADVLAAWKDYLVNYNFGRGVVLIGHSQGAGVLSHLIADEIDGNPLARSLLVSAILLGGGVTVAKGSTVGGDFRHVPACTSAGQAGCVVAFASWHRTPPKDAWAQDVGSPSQQILCVNPAAPGGGSAPITPIFAGMNPQGVVPYDSPYVKYNWVEFPGLYTARCVRDGSRAWLLVTRTHVKGDRRPTVQPALGHGAGLHAADVTIALGDLVDLVASQSRAWRRHR